MLEQLSCPPGAERRVRLHDDSRSRAKVEQLPLREQRRRSTCIGHEGALWKWTRCWRGGTERAYTARWARERVHCRSRPRSQKVAAPPSYLRPRGRPRGWLGTGPNYAKLT